MSALATDARFLPERERFTEELAAVDDHRLAGDPARGVRDEEGDRGGDVGGLPYAAQRHRGGHLLLIVVQRSRQPSPLTGRAMRLRPTCIVESDVKFKSCPHGTP